MALLASRSQWRTQWWGTDEDRCPVTASSGKQFQPLCVGGRGGGGSCSRAESINDHWTHKLCVGDALARMALSSGEYSVLKKTKTCVSVDVLASEAFVLISKVKK